MNKGASTLGELVNDVVQSHMVLPSYGSILGGLAEVVTILCVDSTCSRPFEL